MIDAAGGDAESQFLTASDGVHLHYLHWRSGTPPSAVLVFLHGIASHAGWFAETAADLSHQGVDVYGLDRRGSGRSDGPRGHLARYERALDDVEQLVRLVSSDHPGTPVFLAASSWAAKLAVVYAAQRPGPLSGLLLLGPGLLPRVSLSPCAPGPGRRRASGATPARLPIPLTPELYTANPPYGTSSGPTRSGSSRPRSSSTGRRPGPRPPPPDSHRPAAAAGAAAAGRGRPMVDVPATRRWFAGLPASDTTYRAYPRRRPHPGLRAGAGPRPVPGRTCCAWLSTRSAPGRRRTAMPTVTQLDLFAVDLPFKVAFRHAAAARTTSDSVFLRARLDDGTEGWGECLPRAYVSGERRERGVCAAPRDTILPALVGQEFRRSPRPSRSWRNATARRPPSGSRRAVPQTSAWCSGRPGAAGRVRQGVRGAGPAGGGGVRRRRPRPSRRTGTAGSCPPGTGGPGGEIAAQAARVPVPSRQAQARARRDPAGGADSSARCSAAGSSSGSTRTWPGTSGRRSSVIGELQRVGIRSIEQPIAAATWPGWRGWCRVVGPGSWWTRASRTATRCGG